ncbi:MAG: oxidoreductase [Candidatus Bipolaricaulota bacterium]
MAPGHLTMSKEKMKFAAYWASSCGGCDVALLGLHESILDLLDHADIVFWPAATDFKYDDLRGYQDDEIDITFFNGGIRTDENEEVAHLLREKSKTLVAYGSCAAQGGIPGLANLSSREQLLETVYTDNPTTDNPDNVIPEEVSSRNERELRLPGLQERVRDLGQVVEVDLVVPGCPPPPDLTGDFLQALLDGGLPEGGSVFAGQKTVCDECNREWKGESISEIHRPHEVDIDPDACLLDQGIICMGPATRSGCGAGCPEVNAPCKGCFGPPAKVDDQGTEMLNSLASILQVGEEGKGMEEEMNILTDLPDPIGSFYAYSLPTSIFGGGVEDGGKDE